MDKDKNLKIANFGFTEILSEKGSIDSKNGYTEFFKK